MSDSRQHDSRTDTAFESWEQRWRTDEGRASWLRPEADVRDIVQLLRRKRVERVLDLGSGVGRHALYLASRGFTTCAHEASASGLRYARQAAAQSGATLALTQGLMTVLPYADQCFDYVLAWNVIYHGDGDTVRHSVAELERVLRPGGVYQGTMLAKRNANYGVGREVAPDTFVIDGHEEKRHPHFYCDEAGVAELFSQFDLLSLTLHEHSEPRSFHWHLVAEKIS